MATLKPITNWFMFAGVKSTDKGVYVQKFPPITRAEERQEFVDVPGRSGSLTLLEGEEVFNDIILSVGCYIKNLNNLNEICKWLRGRGVLVLGNMPGYHYDARCVNQIEMEKVVPANSLRTFNAIFRCKPFRYIYPAPAAINLLTTASITNPGTVPSEPKITVTGEGEVTLTIGEKSVDVALPEASTTIVIDVPAGFAYSEDGTINLTSLLTPSDWPLTIPPGVNAVNLTGTVTAASLLPNWRYI